MGRGDDMCKYIGHEMKTKNELQLSVDWLSWTFPDGIVPSDAILLMGYKVNEFRECSTGKNGYKSQLVSDSGISIQYDGSKGMGVHVDVSGSAVSDLIEHFIQSRSERSPFGLVYPSEDSIYNPIPVLKDLFSEIASWGKFTRLDLAIDDIGARYYTITDIAEILREERFVSKFRTWKEIT